MKLNIQLFADAGSVVINVDLNSKGFELEIDATKKELDRLVNEYKLLEKSKPFEGQEKGLLELQNQIEKTRNKYVSLKEKQAELNNADVSKLGNGLSSVTSKITKMGLGIIGVSSLFRAARRATSAYLADHEATAQKMSAIWTALGNLLGPIIEKIANWLMKLIGYINVFVKAISGGKLDITKNMNKNTKATQGTAKAMKEVNKQLAGFDEMNVLGKDTQASAGAGLGGIGKTDFEFPELNQKFVEKLENMAKWLKENWYWIQEVGKVLAITFAASKIAGWVSNIGKMLGVLGPGTGLLGTLTSIVGIGAIVITGYVAVKLKKEVKQLKKDVETIRKNGTEGQKDWIKNEDDINKLIKTGNVNREAGYELLKKVNGVFYQITGLGEENLKTAKQTAINIGNQVDKSIELYKQGKLNNDEQKKLKQNIIDQYEYNARLIDVLKSQGWETGQIESLNRDLIQNYKDMGGEVTFVKDQLGNINGINFDKKKLSVFIDADTQNFSKAIDNAYKYAKKKFGDLFGFAAGGGGTGSKGSGSGGGSRAAKGAVLYPTKLPKLALGGIVNMPGRGIPYGGAIIAERGAEAVVPLTDSQQMALLGETIGRYVRIDNVIDVNMDSRKIKRIMATSDSRDRMAGNG